MGTTLVDRGLRPLRLTEAGSALARRAGSVFEQLAVAELELDAIANLSAGKLRLGTFSSAGAATMVVDALRVFRASNPEVDVSVAEIGIPSAVIRALRAGELDLGISFDYPETAPMAQEGIDLVPLLDDPCDVVLPRGHRLERETHYSASATCVRRTGCCPTSVPTAPASR